MDWDNKTNDEIVVELKQMREEHESIKSKILTYYSTMEKIEKEFYKGNDILTKRLGGDK